MGQPMEEEYEFAWMAWSPQDVGNWIENVLGVPHGATFKEKQIDGPTLLELSDDDLRTELGVADPIQRKKITGHIKVLRLRRARLAQMGGKPQASNGRDNGRSDPRKRSLSARDYSLDEGLFKDDRPEVSARSRRLSGNNDRFSPSSPQNSARSLSRDCSMASSISNRSDDGVSLNRYSRYISQNPSTRGLTSCFGLDSPSFSVQGSFSRAERGVGTASDERSHRRDPRRYSDGGPGPATYAGDPTSDSFSRLPNPNSFSPRSPVATIGNSSRDTSEFIIAPGTQPGSGKCYAKPNPTKIKGGVISSAPRWQYGYGFPPTPGPSSYSTRVAFLSTFK